MTARRSWFRVASSLFSEPLTRDQRMVVLELIRAMCDRWARDGLTAEESAWIRLSRADLHRITNLSRLSSGRNCLRTVSELVSIRIQFDGDWTIIHWPNLPKFQALDRRDGAEVRPDPVPSRAESAPAPAQALKKGVSPSSKPSRKSAPPAPEDALQHAKSLVASIKRQGIKRLPSEAQLAQWARTLDLMQRKDRWTGMQIEQMIRWLEHDQPSEAKFVVHSAGSLSKKADRIWVAMQRMCHVERPKSFLEAGRARIQDVANSPESTESASSAVVGATDRAGDRSSF